MNKAFSAHAVNQCLKMKKSVMTIIVSHLTQIVEITLYILILSEMFGTLEIRENYNIDYMGKYK